jgi:hypothetical protein
MGGIAEVSARVPYPHLTNFGLEVSFTYNSNISYYYFRIYCYDGTNIYSMDARIDTANTTLELNVGGVYTAVDSSINLYESNYLFNTIKVVGDFINNKYLRLIFNNNEYQFDPWGLEQGSSSEKEHLKVDLIIGKSGPGNYSAYFDNILITYNEPPIGG